MPNEAARCVVSAPAELPEPIRGLMGLVSQSDRLPWAIQAPLVAYARVEVALPDERKVRVDYLRFGIRDRAAIRAAVNAADERQLNWGEGAPACAGELTCVEVGAAFLDPHTVRLATGPLPEDFAFEVGSGRCAHLLAELPDAVEVSAREGPGLFDRRELLGTESALFVRARSVERLIRRHFLSPALSARAARRLATGAEEGALLAGIPVRSSFRVDEAILEQRSEQSLEELWLGVEDRSRLERALAVERKAEEGAIDPEEAFERVAPERVLAHVEQALLKLPQAGAARETELHRLARMLARARTAAPQHDALARREFQVRCDLLGDGLRALTLADARIAAGADAGYWQLARRRALARFDVPRLATELARAHGMSDREVARAAAELARQVQRGDDYERAEWALLTAHSMLSRARGAKRARPRELKGAAAREVRLALELVPRLFAYWARLGPAGEARDLGIHLVAFGTRAPQDLPPDARHWAQDTHVKGRDASVFAATTWEDEALNAQGRALARRLDPGPLELLVAIQPLTAPKRGAQLILAGHVEGSEFVVDELSAALSHVHWDTLARGLLKPLGALHGSVFPPDELVFEALTASELDAARRAAEEVGDLACSTEGLAMRCRGGVGDVRAAARGLLRSARVVLGADANALWSGHDERRSAAPGAGARSEIW